MSRASSQRARRGDVARRAGGDAGRRGIGDPRRSVLVGVLAGALAGLALAQFAGGRLERPEQLSHEEWDVVSPALNESLKQPDLGRGCSIGEGALIIRLHAFHRSDILSHRDEGATAEIDVVLEETSGPLSMVLRGDGKAPPLFVRLAPHAYSADMGRSWTTRDTPGVWIVRIADGYAWLDTDNGPTRLGAASPGKIEFTAEDQETRVSKLRLVDSTGREQIHRDFSAAGVGALTVMTMVAIGAAAGLLAAMVGSAPLALLLALPPLLVPLISSSVWMELVERMYLVQTPFWSLSRIAWGLSFVPLAMGALVGSGVFHVPPRATRTDWFLRAAAAVPFLAWPPTAWIGVLLPVLLIVANAQRLVRENPRIATNVIFACVLLFPFSIEWGLRFTYLGEGWDSKRLSGEAAPTVAWRTAVPYWSSQCTEEPRDATVKMVFTGGSSTGGAYQFRGEPDAFFPAQVLSRLCAAAPAGVNFAAANYGDGGRDSYTVSRAIDYYMDQSGSDLVVFYGGVNDLLTTNNTLTRKQREAAEAERNVAVSGLAALAAGSRLITGLSLPFHPPDAASGAHVQDVPLPDAEENLRLLAATVGKRGGKVLLLPEYVRDDNDGQLKEYAKLESRLADELDNVYYVDVYGGMEAFAGEQLLVDRNHLSRAGAGHLADLILPTVRQAVGR